MHARARTARDTISVLREPELLCAWLNRAIEWPKGVRVRSAGVNRLWAGRRKRITFELALDIEQGDGAGAYMLQGRLGASIEAHREHKAARIERGRLAGIRIANAAMDVAFWTPDRDRKLPVVRQLFDEQGLREALAGTASATLLGFTTHAPGDHPGVRGDLVAYRAGKRCVVSVRSDAGGAESGVYIKAFRRPPTAQQVDELKRLGEELKERSDGLVRIPSTIDHVPDKRLVVTRAISDDQEPVASAGEGLRMTARALRALHGTVPRVGPPAHTVRQEFQTACRWVSVLKRLGYGEFVALRDLAMELSRLMPKTGPGDDTLIHRDFYGAQLRIAEEAIWLTDFDTLAIGNAEVDVSTYVAHMLLDSGLTEDAWPQAEASARTFVEAYLDCGGTVRREHLRFHLPCAIARLGAVHLVRGFPADRIKLFWRRAREFARLDRSIV